MCHDIDAHPPVRPIAGAAVDSEDLVLTSADGTRFAAFAARAARTGGAGMVVLPDVRGLFPFYEELALRFAENGIHSVAFDYFGRTGGVAKRGADFEFMPHVRQTKAELIADDVRACVDYLRSPEGGACTSVFTVGFCFGGSNSWLQSANVAGLAGAIGFYGRPGPSFADGSPGPTARASEMKAPILGFMGGADQGIPETEVQGYRDALTAAGVPNEVITYEGAPHSFFDRMQTQYQEQSDDAWRRILAFVAANSA